MKHLVFGVSRVHAPAGDFDFGGGRIEAFVFQLAQLSSVYRVSKKSVPLPTSSSGVKAIETAL